MSQNTYEPRNDGFADFIQDLQIIMPALKQLNTERGMNDQQMASFLELVADWLKNRTPKTPPTSNDTG